MLFKLNSILLSIIFAIALEVSVFRENWFFGVLVFLITFSVLMVWPFARKIRFLAIPFFLSIGSLNLLILIDNPVEKHIFILLASLAYYVSLIGAYRLKLYDCDQTAQGMVNLATFAAGFFWFVSNYGWYLNFQIGAWVLVLTFIGSTFFIGLPSLMISQRSCLKLKVRGAKKQETQKEIIKCAKKGEETVLFLSVILSFVMGEVIWGLSLWPFAYLTTGVVALIIYFVLWDVVRRYILSTLSLKTVFLNVVLALIAVAGILYSAQWGLVV